MHRIFEDFSFQTETAKCFPHIHVHLALSTFKLYTLCKSTYEIDTQNPVFLYPENVHASGPIKVFI